MRQLRYIASLAIVLMAVLPMQAQTENQAFYIYQNDGHFDGFFYDEIEKMTFSFLDTLGVEHDEIVSQEIITADSTYRIMLSAIDSIGFQQPEIIMNKRLHRRDYPLLDPETYSNYGDDLEFWFYLKDWTDEYECVFSTDMPEEIRPRMGDVFADFDTAYGFATKVESVSVTDYGIVVHLKDIDDITDIFEQFVSIEEYGYDDEGNLARRRVSGRPDLTVGEFPKKVATKRGAGQWEGDVFNFSLNGWVTLYDNDDKNIAINVAIDGKLHIKTVWNLSLFGDKYISIGTKLSYGIGAGFRADAKIKDFFPTGVGKFASVPVPAGCPLFYINIGPDAFLRGDAHVTFALTTPKFKGSISSKLIINNWVPHFSMNPGSTENEDKAGEDDNTFGGTLSLNGFVQMGMLFPLTFESLPTIKKFFDITTGSYLYVGPKVGADFTIDMKDLYKSLTAPVEQRDKVGLMFYSQLKNTTLQAHLLDADYEVKANLQTIFGEKKAVTLADGSINLFPPLDMKLAPEFGNCEESIETVVIGGIPQKCRVFAFKPDGLVIKPIEIGAEIFYHDTDDGSFDPRPGWDSDKWDPVINANDIYSFPVTYYNLTQLMGQKLPKDHWPRVVIPYVEGDNPEPYLTGYKSGKFKVRPYVMFGNYRLPASTGYEFEHGAILHLSGNKLFLNADYSTNHPITTTGNCDVFAAYTTELKEGYGGLMPATKPFPDYLELSGSNGHYTLGGKPDYSDPSYNPKDTLRYGIQCVGKATIEGETFWTRIWPLDVCVLPSNKTPKNVNLSVSSNFEYINGFVPTVTLMENGRGWHCSIERKDKEEEIKVAFDIEFDVQSPLPSVYITQFNHTKKVFDKDDNVIRTQKDVNTSSNGNCNTSRIDNGFRAIVGIEYTRTIKEKSSPEKTETGNEQLYLEITF